MADTYPRRGEISCTGNVTATELNSSTNYGKIQFGNPYFNNANEGDWYATKTS